MSIVTIIRDYVEYLNSLSDSFGGFIPAEDLLRETGLYLVKTFQVVFIYIFTFQWLHDFTLLPIKIPQLSNLVLQEKLFLDNSSGLLFNFLDVPAINQNSFLSGFFNSLFLSFPVSIVHIIAIRRLYIKGIPSAVFSLLGYLGGQIFFIICVLSGFRIIINSWFILEPLNYIIGIIIIFRILYQLTQESLRPIPSWNEKQYLNFFVTSFVLAWCEQSSIFQYLGNLSLGPNSSLLETPIITTNFQGFFQHTWYIVGLILGSIIFTIFWGIFCFWVKNLLIRYTPLSLTGFVQRVNKGSFVVAIALGLSSIPFYGFDYILTGPLGFVSQDKVFKNTVFDPYNIEDSALGLGLSSQFTSVDLDVTPFDRGRYLLFPLRTLPFSFEDLNYRGEEEWVNRFDKISTFTTSRAGVFSLSKILKKPKALSSKTGDGEIQNPFAIKSNFSLDSSDSISEFEDKNSRFANWYSLNDDMIDEESGPLENTFLEYQDTSFPLDFVRTGSTEPKNIDLKIKENYYSNPVYHRLLAFDVDLLLNSQPSKFRLNKDQELDLYTKRRILTGYFDSMRDYSKLPYSLDFEAFFDGSKSFTNKVYNQQFKGTLRSVCRLFSLTSDVESVNNSNQMVLKYDQPLYVFSKNKNFSSYHEELNFNEKTSSPFLEDMISAPLYAGWDQGLRKFIITNRFLPRKLSGIRVNLDQKYLLKSKKVGTKKFTKKAIKFTVWPLNRSVVTEIKTKSTIPFTTLFTTPAEFETHVGVENLSNLPSNWESITRKSNLSQTYDNIFDYLAPQRGGFIWPGNSTPRFTVLR